MKRERFGELYNRFGVLMILVVEIVVFAVLSSNFLSVSNLLSVGRQVSFIGIAAVGSAFLMISGGIDISNGAMLAFSGVLCTILMADYHIPMAIAIVITLVVGFLAGAVSGLCYVKLKISPLIATLSMQTILKGIAYIVTNAKPIYGFTDTFKKIGQGYIFNIIPIPLLVMIVMFVFGYWLLNHTYMGRYIYAVGGNAEAARLSGINTSMVSVLVFAASSFFAAIAGIMMAGRLGSGQPAVGVDFPMDVITAIVLGGVGVNGGSGKITGVFVGVFIMGILSNGMVMIGLSDYWQWVVKGLVLLIAVGLSNIYSRSEN